MNETNKSIIKMIMQNYVQLEESIVNQLNMSAKHPGSLGRNREMIWKGLFEQIIPKKFSIEHSVFIIDSKGQVSREVDLVILDEQYTPYIFKYGQLKYIPIEAVAAVVECKSHSLKKEEIKSWHDEISKLETSSNSIIRMASGILISKNVKKDNNEKEQSEQAKESKQPQSTQTATRPIKILCHMDTSQNEYLKEIFDLILLKKEDHLEIIIPEDKKLDEWYLELNHAGTEGEEYIKSYPRGSNEKEDNPSLKAYKVNYKEEGIEKKNTILTLIFQLNQLLMLINNPIPFPHRSYVKLFNDVGKEQQD